MDCWLANHFEIFGLRTLHILNIDLEHSSAFGPKCHVYAVMVEVQNWNLISQLHYTFKLFIQLEANKDSIHI